MPTSPVVVVGSIMQDLSLACAEFPVAGQTLLGRLSAGQGGKGSNQAIACGRTGVGTTFVGAMGRDPYATQVAAFYRREGIGCRIALKRGVATGTAIILLYFLNFAGMGLIMGAIVNGVIGHHYDRRRAADLAAHPEKLRYIEEYREQYADAI